KQRDDDPLPAGQATRNRPPPPQGHGGGSAPLPLLDFWTDTMRVVRSAANMAVAIGRARKRGDFEGFEKISGPKGHRGPAVYSGARFRGGGCVCGSVERGGGGDPPFLLATPPRGGQAQTA